MVLLIILDKAKRILIVCFVCFVVLTSFGPTTFPKKVGMIPTINTLVATKPKQHQNNVFDILNSQTNPTLG